ncbi:MAG: AMP-binding protein [Bowdeniella nasicola]|nr:AMP-binding protein [Bowdeniella nasicola]
MSTPVSSNPVNARDLDVVVGGTNDAAVERVSAALAPRLASPGVRPPALLIAPDSAPGEPERIAERIRHLPGDVEVIVRTSGSTSGLGRLVGLTARQLLSSAQATLTRLAPGPDADAARPATLADARAALRPGEGAQWVTSLPTHHIAGLQVLTRALVADTAPVVADFPHGFDPQILAACVRAAPAHRPRYLSLVPTQLDTLVQPDHRDAARALAERLDAILVGGAALAPSIAARAAALHLPIRRTYGMSETGGGCVYDGVPLPGVRLTILEPDHEGVGRIQITGPMVVPAYLDEEAQTRHTEPRRDRQAPHSAPDQAPSEPGDTPALAESRPTAWPASEHADATITTSDLGVLSDGILTVLGRADDVIISGGVNVSPTRVEHALAERGLDAVVVGVPDEHWGQLLTVVLPPADAKSTPTGAPVGGEAPAKACAPDDLHALTRSRPRAAPRTLGEVRALCADLPAAERPRALVRLGDLPTRGPGKIDRRALAHLAATELNAGRGEVRGAQR